MPSTKQVFDYLEGKIASDWESGDGVQTIYPNVGDVSGYRSGTDDYCELEITIGPNKAMEVGRGGTNNVFSRYYGVLEIRVFTQKQNGDSVLYGYKDTFDDLFDFSFEEGITFDDKGSVGPHDNTEDGDWRVLTCFVNFNFSKS